MKHWLSIYTCMVFTLILSFSAQAHDPSEHMETAEKPDCTMMETMDHSNMDQSDPVMQAIMMKCMKNMHHNEKKESNEKSEHSKHAADDHSTQYKH